MNGWIGVDLDGTLAHYDGWKGPTTIGEPIPEMRDRVKHWLDEGKDVRIFTARVGPRPNGMEENIDDIRAAIEHWCMEHLGRVLPVTCTKDFAMIELWDDRCVQVVPNVGTRALAPEMALTQDEKRVVMYLTWAVKAFRELPDAEDAEQSLFIGALNTAISVVLAHVGDRSLKAEQ